MWDEKNPTPSFLSPFNQCFLAPLTLEDKARKRLSSMKTKRFRQPRLDDVTTRKKLSSSISVTSDCSSASNVETCAICLSAYRHNEVRPSTITFKCSLYRIEGGDQAVPFSYERQSLARHFICIFGELATKQLLRISCVNFCVHYRAKWGSKCCLSVTALRCGGVAGASEHCAFQLDPWMIN